jgi:hypothetical protein
MFGGNGGIEGVSGDMGHGMDTMDGGAGEVEGGRGLSQEASDGLDRLGGLGGMQDKLGSGDKPQEGAAMKELIALIKQLVEQMSGQAPGASDSGAPPDDASGDPAAGSTPSQEASQAEEAPAGGEKQIDIKALVKAFVEALRMNPELAAKLEQGVTEPQPAT